MKRNHYSLYTALGIIIVSVVVSVVSIYSAIAYYSTKGDMVEAIQNIADATLNKLQKNVAPYMLAYAVNEYEMLILNEMVHEDFYAIIVEDLNMGKVLGIPAYVTGKIRGENWSIIDFDPESSVQQSRLRGCFHSDSASLLSDSGEQLGSITICSSDRSVVLELQKSIRETAVSAISISLLLILLLFFTIRRIVLKPVSAIVKGLGSSSNVDLPFEKVPSGGADEIRILATTINGMIDTVHQRENEIKQSEFRFRSLIEHAADGIFIADLDGRYVDVNGAGCKMLGFDRDELLGKTIVDLVPPEDVQRLADSKDAMLEGETHISEWRLLRKDGSFLPVEVSANILPNGQWQGFVRDITERKQAQEKIRRYSEALEQSGEAIVITDAAGTIQHINPAYSEITGYSPEEVIGKNPRMLKSGSQNAHFYEKMWSQLLKGKTWQGKVVNRRKSGEQYPAMLTISPIRDERGETINYIGIQQNLERFEELEAQFYQSQKMEAIGTLVGGIAHDFNNTLAGITGNLYLAKKASASLPDVAKRLESVERLSFSAAATIQQLLAFSRKGIVQMNPISIDSFLKEAIKLNQVSVPENIKLQLQVIDAGLRVKGDINQLQQLLLNLVNNSVDAVDGCEAPTIQIRLEKVSADAAFVDQHEEADQEAYALISVIDNGHGISQEDVTRIFEPFFTTKEPGKGTGLGLAMVYGSVKTHGGFLNVVSPVDEDAGTRMEVYLPLMESGEGMTIPDIADQVSEGHGETILLVDDNQTVLDTGRDVLEGLNYRVITAMDGLEAVSIYQSRQSEIDMVILDVVMPKMSGPEALEAIKAMAPGVKAMFATGYDKLSTLGINEQSLREIVITKPFAVSQLSQAIRQVLNT